MRSVSHWTRSGPAGPPIGGPPSADPCADRETLPQPHQQHAMPCLRRAVWNHTRRANHTPLSGGHLFMPERGMWIHLRRQHHSRPHPRPAEDPQSASHDPRHRAGMHAGAGSLKDHLGDHGLPAPQCACGNAMVATPQSRVFSRPAAHLRQGLHPDSRRRTVRPGAWKLLCHEGRTAIYPGYSCARIAGARSLWREGGEYKTRKGNKPACLVTGFQPLAASLAVESHACGARNAITRARA